MTPLIEKHSNTSLGELVIMLSLDGVQPLLPYVCLTLDDAQRLQELCCKITLQVDEAVYDEDAMGWNRRLHELSQRWKDSDIGCLQPEDRQRLLFWLENGSFADPHAFPHRVFWHKAFRWVVDIPEALDALDPKTLPLVTETAQQVTDRQRDEAYEVAKERFAAGPDSFLDTFQKAKFHINVIPGAIVSQHLIGLNWMRRTHIMRTVCEAFIDRGHDIAILEDMVRRYASAEVTSKLLVDYVSDNDAFAFANLWSDTYREGPA